MGARRYWLVATDAESLRLWSRTTTPARNPFTGVLVTLTMVEAIDEAAVSGWPGCTSLGPSPHLLALALECYDPTLGALMTNELLGDGAARIVMRFPPERLPSLVETDAATLAREWGKPSGGPISLAVTELAALQPLARDAITRAGTLWGFYLDDEEP